MEKNFSPADIEKKWYDQWLVHGSFKCGQTDAQSYTIMLPPPNVTGTLHMGHGFQMSLMDILIRYHRMKGYDTLWQPGTDHAGIATQMVVERQLQSEGISRYEIGREAFLDHVWEWKRKSGHTITNQMQRIGASVDWSRERFTMDETLSKAVQEEFIRLYREGIIYRGKKLVNWDPELQTAVSDLEVESEEESGHLWHIYYPAINSERGLTIATTRPETMLGDAALAVHPEDDRYADWIGSFVQVPLTDRSIPVIADEHVERSFGTGCLKITPAHDFNDYTLGISHQLPFYNILTKQAYISNEAPLRYQGLNRFEARKKIVDDLQDQGLLVSVKPYQYKVPRGDRSKVIIEPFLTEQWFMKMDKLAKPAIEAVEKGYIKFIPENWQNTYFSWMNNIQDWCISRQLWWGHRIPAWYDNYGNIYVGKDEFNVRQTYRLSKELNLKRDEDVFDTWFSSALWPFSTLGWPESTNALAKYYPTDTLITGFDIIFFWVARMIMMGLKFMEEVPFCNVYITGLIRDADGQKMSKSKGNVLDPVDLIDGITVDRLIQKRTSGMMQPQMQQKVAKATKRHYPSGIKSYGADALRFTFAALASTSRDICFDVNRMEGYRNFCNKLWNAARFVLQNLSYTNYEVMPDKAYDMPEKWIWHSLNTTIESIEHNIKVYRFDLIAQHIYDFVWHDYCDWYLEIAKCRLGSNEFKSQHYCIEYTLISILEQILKLAHPVIPFITEEIYDKLKSVNNEKGLLINAQYPESSQLLESPEAQSIMHWFQNIVKAVRTIRSQMNIKPASIIQLMIKNTDQWQKAVLRKLELMVKAMVNADSIIIEPDEDKMPVSALTLVGEMQIFIPLAGLIDVQSEKTRITNELAKLNDKLTKITKKLENQGFVANAPAEIVKSEKDKYNAMQSQIEKLYDQYRTIEALEQE